MDVAGQWREGILFPRWAEWANWGYGEPRFIFYPPASWLAGAALGSILPWIVAPGAFVWLALMLAGYSMWRFASDYLPRGPAAGAAVLYAVNPYHIVVVYYRSDFAELLASAIFPLVMWGALRVLREGWRSLPKLAIPFAAMWLSNAPAAVLATYSLALMILVWFAMHREAGPALAASASMAAGFGLAAFYILPAAWEQRWAQIAQVLVDLLRPGNNFIYTHADSPEFLFFNWKVSTVGVLVILTTGIGAVFAARRRAELRDVWWLLFSLGCAATLLMFPMSNLAWRWLPKLQFVQFPWRWMGPLGFILAFFMAVAFANARRAWLCWAMTFAAVAGLGTVIASDAWWDSEDIPGLVSNIQSGRGYEGTDEYQPRGSNRYELPGVDNYGEALPGPPTAELMEFADAGADSDEGEVGAHGIALTPGKWTADSKTFSTSSAGPVVVAVRLLDYPSWVLKVGGSQIAARAAAETGQMLIPVPAGKHRVTLTFERTWDRTTGGAISVLSLVFLAAFAGVNQRRGRASN